MNNLKKVGLTALAGSLVAFSAQAVEMAVSGSAKLTYNKWSWYWSRLETRMGMNTSLAFSGSGEVNGYATNLLLHLPIKLLVCHQLLYQLI